MATRIKRYEERRERMPELLARIEKEMGPDAQIEQKYFKRGAWLGLIGGLSMVEVVATVEVSDEQLRIGNYHRRAGDEPNGANAINTASIAQENIAAAAAPSGVKRPAPPRMVPLPSELAARSAPGRVDLRADEQPKVSLASGVLDLAADSLASETPAAKPAVGARPAAKPTNQVKPQFASSQPSSVSAKPEGPGSAASRADALPAKATPTQPPATQRVKPEDTVAEPAALNQHLPGVINAAPPPAASAPAAKIEPGTNNPELREDIQGLRESISELKETVKLLVQVQVQGAAQAGAVTQTPAAQPLGRLDGASAPEGTAAAAAQSVDPAEALAQAAQRKQAEEAQQLLDLLEGGAAGPAAAAAAPGARAVADPLSLDPGAGLGAVQRQVYERLLDWNIGPYDALELINAALTSISEPAALSSADILKVITGNICRNILLSGGIKLGKTPPGKVVALVGATGVGKTTTIAKLAAKFAFQEGQRVSLVSLDNYRIAAAEQLRTYSEIMGIDLDIVFSKDEFDAQLSQRRHSDLVLIDTAGRSPINTKQIYELREVFTAHPPDEVHLVVSASTKGDDLRAILENFTPLGYDHIIVSKLDETRSLGAIYNISKHSQCPISYVTVGQRVPEDIRTATLPFIQQWIEQGRAL